MADHGFKDNKDIVNLESYMETWYNNKLNRMFPTGSIIYTASDATPVQMGYPGTWQRLAGGRVLVSKSDVNGNTWNKPTMTSGGASGVPFHTHTIFSTEEWKDRTMNLSEERQIYSDVIPMDNDDVDQAASASGGDPVWRYVMHSKDGAGVKDHTFGSLEMIKTYPNTKLKSDPGHNYPSPNNPIKASNVGDSSKAGQYDLGYPPFYIVNIWRRVS